MPKLKILVTGGAGQVGSEFAHLAESSDHEIIVCSRAELDVCNRHQIEQKIAEIAPDAVINCAAYTAVDKAEDNVQQAYRLNQTAVDDLASVCAAHQVYLVHYSTDYVFDGAAVEPYSEEDNPNPQSVYGASKLAGEESVRSQLAHHLIIRVSWVFGRIGQSFVDTMLRLASERPELRVVGDQFGCPNSAMWIAKTTMQMLEMAHKDPHVSGTYHLSSEPEVSWFEFAASIIKTAAELKLIEEQPQVTAITTSEYPTKAKRPMYSVLSNSKAQRTFGLNNNNWHDDLKVHLMQAKSLRDTAS